MKTIKLPENVAKILSSNLKPLKTTKEKNIKKARTLLNTASKMLKKVTASSKSPLVLKLDKQFMSELKDVVNKYIDKYDRVGDLGSLGDSLDEVCNYYNDENDGILMEIFESKR